MIAAFKKYIGFLKNPHQWWSILGKNATVNHHVSAYQIMVFAALCTVLGNAIEYAGWIWSSSIIDFLVTFISLLASFYISFFFIKIYYENTEQQPLGNHICIRFVAFASAALYFTLALVELTHMPLFWVLSIYTLKLVLEAVQSHYIVVDDKHKYTFVWVCSIILVLTPIITQHILELIVKI